MLLAVLLLASVLLEPLQARCAKGSFRTRAARIPKTSTLSECVPPDLRTVREVDS